MAVNGGILFLKVFVSAKLYNKLIGVIPVGFVAFDVSTSKKFYNKVRTTRIGINQ